MVLNNIFFSVIIPTYNRGEKLIKCMESLQRQTFKFFEVIICDDGSTDNTKVIVDSFKDKLDIKYLWDNNSGGPARPRNNGIKIAQGTWICFLDSDDSWYSNKLWTVNQYITANPQIDFVCHDLTIKYVLSNKTERLFCGPIIPNLYSNLLKYGNRFPNSAISVKRSTLKHNKIIINESIDFISVEDYDFCLQLAACNASFGCINTPLGEYLIETTNISSASNHLKNLECLLKFHVFEVQTFESDKLNLWKEVSSRLNTIKATESYRHSRYLDSINYFVRAFKLSKKSFLKYILDRITLSLKRISRTKCSCFKTHQFKKKLLINI